MTEETITTIMGAVILLIATIALILMGIYDLKKTIKINENKKEFNKTLTQEQKALIHDYEQCNKVNLFKKDK